ncbi:unnamed protein product [Adineta steineri]|uniref:PLD phosphodiesterase domain-containing protein n=2 Tax=Adineta steineri TaxID=433720 RepID=A0A813Q6N2_9BILA|nr:unnamed protein product [Adineta steineri]CAF3546557.1 unnamed protein product [Adineta steineri]CAF3609011.1 unnamed protein product [Adineta steineri]
MISSAEIKTISNEFFDQQEELSQSSNNVSQETVTSLFASGYSFIKSPEDAIKYLFSKNRYYLRRKFNRKKIRHEVTSEELDFAAEFGQFSQRPSDLFLKLFYNVICTLEHDSLAGRVSPALIGSTGVIPLTIISTIPDIMQHYYDVIVHAQKEVLFATMYWEKSESANTIGKAFRDLSERAGYENRHVIIKLIMDHPKLKNALPFHSIIPSSKWTDFNLPSPEEIPNISLEIQNFHRAIMGTFHVKFLVVDRKLVLLNSNNIQDRPNLEMMSQYEGEIVNSFYDTFLISWSIPFQPNLVCLNDNPNITTVEEPIYETTSIDESLLQQHLEEEEADHTGDAVVDNEIGSQSQFDLTEHLNNTAKSAHSAKADKSISAKEMEILSLEYNPILTHCSQEPFPIALVSRLPQGIPSIRNTNNPQDAAWMSAFQYAQKSIFIQSPTLNAPPAINGIVAACRRGIKVTLWLNLGFNDAKEGRGTFQGGTNECVVKKLYKRLRKTNDGIEKNLETFWYTAKDQIRPLHFLQRKRNCHIKFMSIDGQVAIMGNANMDSLSWFHSQEANTMIDSPMIVKEWMDALYRNQSTNAYGKLDTDGIWRDVYGKLNPKNGK